MGCDSELGPRAVVAHADAALDGAAGGATVGLLGAENRGWVGAVAITLQRRWTGAAARGSIRSTLYPGVASMLRPARNDA